MTIAPDERTRAVLDARQLLETLAAGDEITVVNLLRSVAVGVLQHYPLDADLEESAVALPEIWGAPKSKDMNHESSERRGHTIDHQSSPHRITAASQVLYTDLDHTLHRTDAYRAEGGISSGSSSTPFFEFADLLERLLAPYSQVAIVLSTSWVQELGFEETRARFPTDALRARIVDSTYHPDDGPVSAWSAMPRGAQVLRHVRRHGLIRWLAIDDDRKGFDGYESRLIHCQHGIGLGDKDVQQLLAQRLEKMFGSPRSSSDSSNPERRHDV